MIIKPVASAEDGFEDLLETADDHLLPIDKYTVALYMEQLINVLDIDDDYDEGQILDYMNLLLRDESDYQDHQQELYFKKQILINLLDLRGKLDYFEEEIFYEHRKLRKTEDLCHFSLATKTSDHVRETFDVVQLKMEKRYEYVSNWCKSYLYRLSKMLDSLNKSEFVEQLIFERGLTKHTIDHFQSTHLNILKKQRRCRALQKNIKELLEMKGYLRQGLKGSESPRKESLLAFGRTLVLGLFGVSIVVSFQICLTNIFISD